MGLATSWQLDCGDVGLIMVGVFLAGTPFQNQLPESKQRIVVEGWEGWFLTAKELILLRSPANRAIDRVDVSDILFVQAALNVAYLRRRPAMLWLAVELEDALRVNRD